MFLRKGTAGAETADRGPLAVLVQPLAGHTDQEVVELLRSCEARDVTVLSPGFISASLGRSAVKVVEAIARVQEKSRSQPR